MVLVSSTSTSVATTVKTSVAAQIDSPISIARFPLDAPVMLAVLGGALILGVVPIVAYRKRAAHRYPKEITRVYDETNPSVGVTIPVSTVSEDSHDVEGTAVKLGTAEIEQPGSEAVCAGCGARVTRGNWFCKKCGRPIQAKLG